jgi:NADH-quinone oxidoreductase subunit M
MAGPDAWQFKLISVLAVSGVVLGAWYMLWLVERVFFGPLREGRPAEGHDHHAPVKDISLREVAALVPLIVAMVWIGVAPQPFLQVLAQPAETVMAATSRSMSNRSERPAAVSRAGALPAAGQGGAVTRVD